MSKIPSKHLAIGLASPTSGIVALEQPTREPGSDEALIRVLYAAVSNLELWQADFRLGVTDYPFILGISLAGEVVKAGQDAGVKVGDNIISFSFAPGEAKAFQEYALLSNWKVGKIPSNVPIQEAVSVPDNFVTAYWSLFGNLKLPAPSELPTKSSPFEAATPIVIWGAGGSVGQYALQVLHLAGYTNVIGIASSSHHEFLRSLGAAVIFDYKSKDVSEQVLRAAGGPVKYVFDTISDEQNSLSHISEFVVEGSQVAYLLPVRSGGYGSVQGVKSQTDISFPAGVELFPVRTAYYHTNEKFKNELQPKILPPLLSSGLIKPNRIREIQGATLVDRVKEAFDILRKGQVNGEKLVVRISG
ncbi:unnamed protein product [Somion occarium]|uniref:Enoyl reductase (ER) domain-containing protein n=1 Tax=Somion occarium TaxID=3059160 RepID=A0ABP1EA97_9APHY